MLGMPVPNYYWTNRRETGFPSEILISEVLAREGTIGSCTTAIGCSAANLTDGCAETRGGRKDPLHYTLCIHQPALEPHIEYAFIWSGHELTPPRTGNRLLLRVVSTASEARPLPPYPISSFLFLPPWSIDGSSKKKAPTGSCGYPQNKLRVPPKPDAGILKTCCRYLIKHPKAHSVTKIKWKNCKRHSSELKEHFLTLSGWALQYSPDPLRAGGRIRRGKLISGLESVFLVCRSISFLPVA